MSHQEENHVGDGGIENFTEPVYLEKHKTALDLLFKIILNDAELEASQVLEDQALKEQISSKKNVFSCNTK